MALTAAFCFSSLGPRLGLVRLLAAASALSGTQLDRAKADAKSKLNAAAAAKGRRLGDRDEEGRRRQGGKRGEFKGPVGFRIPLAARCGRNGCGETRISRGRTAFIGTKQPPTP